MINALVSVALVAIGLVATPELLVGFGVAAALGMAVEMRVPRRRSALVDLTHAFGDRVLIVPLVAGALAVLGPAVDAAVPDIEGTPVALHFAAVFVATDFTNYLIHRALHRVPLLWRFHAVHHSSEELDWLATSRVHPIDLAVNITVVTLPTYALGEPALAPWLLTLLFVQPFLIHAEVPARLAWLSRVVVTPVFHSWHHAADAAAHDRNFGMFLSVWDRLFGTALDHDDRATAFGVPGSSLSRAGYLDQLVIPLRRPVHEGALERPRRRRRARRHADLGEDVRQVA